MSVYMFQAGFLCEECGKLAPQEPDDGQPHDSDEFAISYPDAGESDSPVHCGGCLVLLDCSLTDDGREYVREALEAGDGNPQVLAEWEEAFEL
jgi:hypothetical protein